MTHPGAPCVVLIHSLGDSPYDVRDLSLALHRVGYNVVAPLLPGHGLLDPSQAFADDALYQKWCGHARLIVDLVSTHLYPSHLFIGGYSTGGSLPLRTLHTLRQLLFTGLLLFAPAFDLYLNDALCRLPGAQWVAEHIDGKYTGGTEQTGSPYRYPIASRAGGVQVTQLIDSNDRDMTTIQIPVLTVHVLEDTTVDPKATMDWMRENCTQGQYLGLSAPGIVHANLTVNGRAGGEVANPMYDELEEAVIRFVERARTHPVIKVAVDYGGSLPPPLSI